MIDPDKRKAIFQLHTEGMSLREISRLLHVSRKTVRQIIQQQGQMPDTVRKDKRQIDPDLLRRLYRECRGWVQRVHERLQEEEDIQIGYSTLTHMLRDLGLGSADRRAATACRMSQAPRCNTILRITTCRWQGDGRRSSRACSTCVTRSDAT